MQYGTMTVTARGAARTARGHISDSPSGGGGNLQFPSYVCLKYQVNNTVLLEKKIFLIN